ncbi:Fimbrial protein [Pseudomonas cuatrocienegasensis]|uniref:Fimbrial protein n=1 Tax=Pseudomonas cuatrocienegasensis TaxID=543360 RepID=A0ABY1BPM3_9PSED|nr:MULTISPECIES: fimbrial protein [Pseudomonas]OEC33761.1 hypothetical protein A7D25_17395 [Pseudomonas sp. 21C1]SER31908.1 Fimbrial protein [Pseudomonas cuatrocienegasensis]
MKVKKDVGACWCRLLALLVLGCWLPLDAQALIGGSLDCNITGSSTTGYTFAAGAEMKVPFSGTCTAKRVFPNGAYPTLQIVHISGSSPARLYGLDYYSNTYLSQLPLGNYGSSCLGGRCVWIPVGGKVSYEYYIGGIAPSTPGRRVAQVTLGVTAIGYPNYAEWIHPMTFIYNVSAVSCTLSSPSAVNLNFGTVSNTNISGQTQSTSVSVNCPSAVTASVTLTPSQTVVNDSGGVSRTTLNGLNMQAIWSDTGNSVTFSRARTMYMSAGNNNVNLRFKPQVVAGQSPAGAFQSQYTLNISYQ